MASTRVPLYDRLPELYRVRDQEQRPPGQLRAFLALLEGSLSAVHENIESLYHDFFIDTCDDWVIPYIGDLLGVSPLAGAPHTLRADVADTILLRRRKGTRAAIERLAFDLADWAAHAVELYASLAWTQHLNHQRPDAGGAPAYAGAPLRVAPRGGTAPIRDPALLALLDSPFDPFAHVVDVKPAAPGQLRYNLPNLAILIWRLAAYRVTHATPVLQSVQATGKAAPAAAFAARFSIHPLAARLTLFNDFHYDPDARPPEVTQLDGVPGPIHPSRLTSRTPFGVPERYVGLTTYAEPPPPALADLGLGLELQLPDAAFAPFDPREWSMRGANLCAWETGLTPPLAARELAIDPRIGRIVVGCATQAQANALASKLRVTYTYGSVGPVGAHPTSARGDAPTSFDGRTTEIVRVHAGGPVTLEQALAGAATVATAPLVVEITDSATYTLDLAQVSGSRVEDGGPNLVLGRSLIVRAAPDQRPVLRLAAPLRFRPVAVFDADPVVQAQLDARNRELTVVLEALYLTPGASMSASDPLLARAAVHALELKECTLDPGGQQLLDPALLDTKKRAPSHLGARLATGFGFAVAAERSAFKETPSIALWRSIAGPLLVDAGAYTLGLTDSIVDAGAGLLTGGFAVSGTTPASSWGAATTIDGVTVFGRTHVERIEGKGGIFSGRLEAFDNQSGCLKYCWFSGDGDRLPQNHACVRAPDAFLDFTSDRFGDAGYGQLTLTTDRRVREQGPGDDEMGAFNFLLTAHKWKNLQIRFREFMPVGVRPLIVPVT